MSTSTKDKPQAVFPYGYEPPNRDRSTYTYSTPERCWKCKGTGTRPDQMDVCTTCEGSGDEPSGRLWDGDTYLGGGHEVRDGYGTRTSYGTGYATTYRPQKSWKPAPRTWRDLPWNSDKSIQCANSGNLFVRLYGIYRDALQNFWACPEHRHFGVRGGAGILPVAMVDGHAMVLLSHRAGFTQHGGTWSTFGGAVDKGETPFRAAVRETFEELSGVPAGGKVAGKLARPCESCGWRYTTYVVVLDIEPADLNRVRGKGSETRGIAWTPWWMVRYFDLHPAFADAWDDLGAVVRGLEG